MPAYGTYMSESTYYEDGYGLVTERIVVASTYADLFMSKATYLASQPFVDILKIGSSKKDVALETGSYAEDELTIKMDQASIESTWDNNCYQLVLQAQDTLYPLYIGYFIQPDDTSVNTLTASAEFIGIIQPEMKAKEIVWRNQTEYDPDTQPLYEWDMKAKSFDLGSFDGDKLWDVLNDLWAETTWRSTNISDRLGYCDLGSGKVTKFANLVNLNVANLKINALMAARISTKIGSTFSIVVDECILDEKFSPARWYNAEYGSGAVVTRYIGANKIDGSPMNINGGNGGSIVYDFYRIYENDAQILKLGDSITDDYSPFISSQMYFWNDIAAGDGSPQAGGDLTDRTNSFIQNEDITFAEYYIGLAASFGLIVRFYYTTATELHIKFSSYSEFVKVDCFIPDVTESDLTTNPFKKNDARKPTYGIACKWADEGKDKEYILKNGDQKSQSWWDKMTKDVKSVDSYIESVGERLKPDGDKLFLTISPTVRCQNIGSVDDIGSADYLQYLFVKYPRIPHNSFITDTSGNRLTYGNPNLPIGAPPPAFNSIGLHTAIYLKITGGQRTNAFGSIQRYTNYGLDTDPIFSPAAAGHYKYNGVDQDPVYKQADYVNYIRSLNDQAYITERNLTVPYLCRFRKTQAGTDTDDDSGRGRWQNLSLGSKITFGTGGTAVTYIVVGIERDSEKKETKIKLWNSSTFAFSAASGLTSAIGVSGTNVVEMINTSKEHDEIASGGITQFQVLIQNSDGTWSKALPVNTHVGLIAGIAMNDAADTESVLILKPGESFFNPAWNFAPRTKLWLRYNATNPGNISATILSEKNVSEDMMLLIGYGTGGLVETVDYDNIDNQLIYA